MELTLRLRLLGVGLSIAALLVTSSAPAVAGPAEEQRLAQTRAQIGAIRARLEAAQAQRDTSAESLAAAAAEVAEVLEAVGSAELAVQRQQQAVDDARAVLQGLEESEAAQRAASANRAATLYKQGSGTPFAALLDSADAADALRRTVYVDVVARRDRRSFESVSIAMEAVAAQREQLQREEDSLSAVLAEQEAILADVEAIRAERADVLAQVESQMGQLAAQESHLEAESRDLAALIRRSSREEEISRGGGNSGAAGTAAAGTAAAGASSSSSGGSTAAAPAGDEPVAAPSSGGWVWPTSGSVTSGFGPRWGRMHEGIDIGAPSGQTIVAARSGRVSFAGQMGGYGNLVLVDHGDGIVTAYAHQSSIGVGAGESVSAGEPIGRVGSTGHSTGPHLHFEVRVGGSPRNPLNYL